MRALRVLQHLCLSRLQIQLHNRVSICSCPDCNSLQSSPGEHAGGGSTRERGAGSRVQRLRAPLLLLLLRRNIGTRESSHANRSRGHAHGHGRWRCKRSESDTFSELESDLARTECLRSRSPLFRCGGLFVGGRPAGRQLGCGWRLPAGGARPAPWPRRATAGPSRAPLRSPRARSLPPPPPSPSGCSPRSSLPPGVASPSPRRGGAGG
mmetsp:Transcript_17585/g.57465  ORF Transcript_17585/g.57465 Transcript_17585/m.57465 type:complete len:209 (+) Transcript_17585:515-1141(+)